MKAPRKFFFVNFVAVALVAFLSFGWLQFAEAAPLTNFPNVTIHFVDDISGSQNVLSGQTMSKLTVRARLDLTNQGPPKLIVPGGTWTPNSLTISTWHPKSAQQALTTWARKTQVHSRELIIFVEWGRFQQTFRGAPGAGSVAIAGVSLFDVDYGLESLSYLTLEKYL